jgi:threonine/homoserine/homoserine lactone efflux protein
MTPGAQHGGEARLLSAPVGSVVGEILPLAVGIAISPLPIIAVILMLLSPRAKATSVGFMIGWLLGIVVAIFVFTLLSLVIPRHSEGGSSAAGVIKIVLGVLLLFLALRQWRARPAEGEQASLPKWVSAIDSMTAAKAFALAFLLAAVNPKNLLLAASAGLIIGGAGLGVGQGLVIVIIIFVLLAACTVVIPVIGYLIASARLAEPLDKLRGWLVENNATIMSVLLLVLGVAVIGKGLGNF